MNPRAHHRVAWFIKISAPIIICVALEATAFQMTAQSLSVLTLEIATMELNGLTQVGFHVALASKNRILAVFPGT